MIERYPSNLQVKGKKFRRRKLCQQGAALKEFCYFCEAGERKTLYSISGFEESIQGEGWNNAYMAGVKKENSCKKIQHAWKNREIMKCFPV